MKRSASFFHYKTKNRWFNPLYVLSIIFIIPFTFLVFQYIPKKESGVGKELATVLPTPTLPIPTPAPYPTNKTGIMPGSEITAGGVVVMDVDSHVYLFERNANMSLSPASTTKLLTALVALEEYKLDDIVTVNSSTISGQLMGLVPGERITVENLLYGALIHSGNDAAWALAAFDPGGVEAFVGKMNQKAQALHLDQSHFTNPMGFDDDAHKVTPKDLSLLSVAAIENPTIAKMVAIPQITVSDVNHTHFHKLANVNQLLGKIPGVGGIKTGWTEAAGENLITYVERNNHKVIVVVLHSKDRFDDTIKLIDWAFDNIIWTNP